MQLEEFDCQVGNLIKKGYPEAAGFPVKQFLRSIESLREEWAKLILHGADPETGRIEAVLVVKNQHASAEKIMSLIERDGKRGIVSMYPVEPESFSVIENIIIPSGPAYLLVDIDRGEDTLNVTPDDALKVIQNRNRSPLTIDEGISILLHYPDFLQKNNCFSLLASRRGDKRVPALWLSSGRPKLGWCWAGNPHTWLGSASCGCRVGG